MPGTASKFGDFIPTSARMSSSRFMSLKPFRRDRRTRHPALFLQPRTIAIAGVSCYPNTMHSCTYKLEATLAPKTLASPGATHHHVVTDFDFYHRWAATVGLRRRSQRPNSTFEVRHFQT